MRYVLFRNDEADAFFAYAEGKGACVQEGTHKMADSRWKVEVLQDTEDHRVTNVVTSFVNVHGEVRAYAAESII